MHELDNIIQHFGVKGMRWGIRKDRSVNTRKPKKTQSKSDKMKFDDAMKTHGTTSYKKYKIMKARVDLYDQDINTGEYTNKSKFARAVRTTDRVMDLAKSLGVAGIVAANSINHSDAKDIIQHFGVKGMKWGVRKDRGTGGNSKVTIRERAGSLKRERQWSKVLKEADNMTNEQLNAVAKRVGLENDLKRLIKESRMATKSDKADYARRKDMDDTELMERVNRLRAKDNLSRKVRDASKEQRELGEKVVNVGSNIALKYVSNKPVTGKDIFDAIVNPDKEAKKKLDNRIRDEAVKRIVDSVTKNSR